LIFHFWSRIDKNAVGVADANPSPCEHRAEKKGRTARNTCFARISQLGSAFAIEENFDFSDISI
jgi:hypothetical protein